MSDTPVTVREARPGDSDALIDLELATPLEMGDVSETYDRSPDFFACHRQKEDCRIVVGEVNGRIVGVTTGSIQQPSIHGESRKIMYVQQSRVHPDFRGMKVAWSMSNHLFMWARQRGAATPYYLISPRNAPSIAFVERGGGRWATDVALRSFDIAASTAPAPQVLGDQQIHEAVRLINDSHAGQDMFETLTVESLTRRAQWTRLYGVNEGGALAAVAGLWDRGAATARIQVNRKTSEETRSRETAVTDWGWAPGHESTFAGLLEGLASVARSMGRDALTICEPYRDALPLVALPSHSGNIAIFTPGLTTPAQEDITGIVIDMLYI